jgi:hypothetical protein
MSTPPPEPRNPLYLLLLLAGLVFVLTALGVALVPVLEEKAADAGQPAPPSPFRDALRKDGWRWLLYELVAVVALGLGSMVLDHVRERRKQAAPPPPSAKDG